MVAAIIAQTVAASPDKEPLITDPAGVLAVLLAALAVIFWLTQHPVAGRIFKIIPSLVFCYFVPTALTTLGVIPDSSPLYDWIKGFVLPAALPDSTDSRIETVKLSTFQFNYKNEKGESYG